MLGTICHDGSDTGLGDANAYHNYDASRLIRKYGVILSMNDSNASTMKPPADGNSATSSFEDRGRAIDVLKLNPDRPAGLFPDWRRRVFHCLSRGRRGGSFATSPRKISASIDWTRVDADRAGIIFFTSITGGIG